MTHEPRRRLIAAEAFVADDRTGLDVLLDAARRREERRRDAMPDTEQPPPKQQQHHMRVPAELQAKVLRLRAKGDSLTRIAAVTGLHRSTVQRIVERGEPG